MYQVRCRAISTNDNDGNYGPRNGGRTPDEYEQAPGGPQDMEPEGEGKEGKEEDESEAKDLMETEPVGILAGKNKTKEDPVAFKNLSSTSDEVAQENLEEQTKSKNI